MDNDPTNAYIPPNLSETGGVFGGMFQLRNLVEGGIFLGLFILLGKMVTTFLIPSMYVTIAFFLIGAMIGIIAVIGVGGEPLSIFCLNVIIYRKVSGYCQIRMPIPENVKGADGMDDAAQEDEEQGKGLLDRMLYKLFAPKTKKKGEK